MLNGIEVTLPEGIGPSGAKDGYFGPTNKDNYIVPPKLSYLTDTPIKRILFKHKVKKKEQTSANTERLNEEPHAGGHPSSCVLEHGSPSQHAKTNLPCNFFHHRPKDYFDLQITWQFVKYIAEATNRHAVAEGVGSKTYADWAPFDQEEIHKFFGLLFANALYPKPQIIFWFLSSTNSKLFGNDHFAKLFDKRLT